MKVIALQRFEVFFIGRCMVRYLREMPLKLRKNCKDQFDCILNSWKSVTWVTRCYKLHMWRVLVDKNCIYYTVSIVHANPGIWSVASFLVDLSEVIVLSPVWKAEGYYTVDVHISPFLQLFLQPSGPFRRYACRSCLLKLLLINCILWEVQCAHWKCIIRLFDCVEIHLILGCLVLMPWRRHKFLWAFSFSCIKKTHQVSWRNGDRECLSM